MRIAVLAAALAATSLISTAAQGQTADHEPSELECVFMGMDYVLWLDAGRAVAGLPVDPEKLGKVNAATAEAIQWCHAEYDWSNEEAELALQYAQINSVAAWLSDEMSKVGITNHKGINDALAAMSQADRDRLVAGGLNTDPAFKADMEGRARLAGAPEAAVEAFINYFAVNVRIKQLEAAWSAF